MKKRGSFMFDKIYDYMVKTNIETLPLCYQRKKIGCYIHINQKGEYLFSEPLDKVELSAFPGITNSGSSLSDVIIEKINIVLNNNSSQKRENDYMNKLNVCLKNCDKLIPVSIFLNSVREDNTLKQQVIAEISKNKLKSDWISFKIGGNPIEKDKDILNAMEKALPVPETVLYGKSSISNQYTELATSSVKFKTPIGRDNPIAPFSKAPSTQSYFQSGTSIARIGIQEMAIIKNALDTLLNDGKHYNSFFNLFFLYEDTDNSKQVMEKTFSFFDYVPDLKKQDDEKKNKISDMPLANNVSLTNNVFNAIEKLDETLIGNVTNEKCFMFFYEPTFDSRHKMYGGEERSLADIFKNLFKFKNDAKISYHSKDGIVVEETIENLRNFLMCFVPKGIEDKNKYIKNIFGKNINDLVYSVFDNKQIPEIFYFKSLYIASHYITIDRNKDINERRYRERQFFNALKTIKLYKNRKENYMQDSNAYRLGKSFAIFEQLQKTVNKSDGVSRLFNSALLYPSQTLKQLNINAKHHLDAAYFNDNQGLKTYYEKLIMTTYEDVFFPEEFTLEEQGDFIIGYWNQRHDLFTKKGDKTNE